MKDQFGREIDYIRISVTDRCNLRCRYCMPPEGVPLVSHEEILRFDEIERLVKIFCAKGIKHVKITGGEPLVRRDVSVLVRRLKQLSGLETVSLTTNGTLLTAHLAALAEAGLDAVNISMDTPFAERYHAITGGRVEDVFRALNACEAYPQIRVKLNCVLLADISPKDIVALADIARSRHVDVRYIEMMPIGLGKKFETIYNEDILEELKKQYPDIQEDRQIHGNGPAVYVKLPGGQGSVGFISALHGKFCQYCNRIRMTAQGCLKPCLCYGKGVELKDIFDRHEKSQRCGITMADQETLEYLYQAITEAIQLKPKSHRFENLSEITEDKKMSQIGG